VERDQQIWDLGIKQRLRERGERAEDLKDKKRLKGKEKKGTRTGMGQTGACETRQDRRDIAQEKVLDLKNYVRANQQQPTIILGEGKYPKEGREVALGGREGAAY